jgi:hypothetical protein
VSQRPQALSCKTSNKRAQFDQRLTSEKQNPQLLDLVVQRDDGRFAIGWGDDAPGPLKSRAFAAAVAARHAPSQISSAAVVTRPRQKNEGRS